MAVQFPDLSSQQGLKQLDEYLLTRSYITGYVCMFLLQKPGCILVRQAAEETAPIISDVRLRKLFVRACICVSMQVRRLQG